MTILQVRYLVGIEPYDKSCAGYARERVLERLLDHVGLVGEHALHRLLGPQQRVRLLAAAAAARAVGAVAEVAVVNDPALLGVGVEAGERAVVHGPQVRGLVRLRHLPPVAARLRIRLEALHPRADERSRAPPAGGLGQRGRNSPCKPPSALIAE